MKLPIDYRKLSRVGRRIVREEYVELQGGLCYYCKCRLDGKASEGVMRRKINWALFPEGFLRYPIHLHHDHVSGMTIGAVHAYCNAVLWQYEGE